VQEDSNQLLIKSEEQHGLAFHTRYSLFEPTVVQLGRTIAAANFQVYFNNTIHEAVDDCTLADLDDILIYSYLEVEHTEYMKRIIQCVLKARCYLKPEICEQ
jgi:hypothetical protein